MKKVVLVAFIIFASTQLFSNTISSNHNFNVAHPGKSKIEKAEKKQQKALLKLEKKKARMAIADNKRKWREEQAKKRLASPNQVRNFY